MNNIKNVIFNICCIIVGIVLIALGMLEYMDSYASGFGGGLIAVGVLQLIRKMRYKNNPEYREKIDVEASDERNKYIRMAAWSWTGYIVVLLLAIAVIVMFILSLTQYVQIFSNLLCLILVIYWVTYLILSRRY